MCDIYVREYTAGRTNPPVRSNSTVKRPILQPDCACVVVWRYNNNIGKGVGLQ